VLVALVAVLAAAALANALITIIGRRRHDIGILRALGFSRAQVLRSTIAIATMVALASSIIGVPFGVIVTRWGWSAVQSRIGVESGVVIPVPLVVGTVLIALSVTQLISLVPGLRATRRRAADALRSE
jgi:putative ABC transport system permease protein